LSHAVEMPVVSGRERGRESGGGEVLAAGDMAVERGSKKEWSGLG
jgi:hypothetical protein